MGSGELHKLAPNGYGVLLLVLLVLLLVVGGWLVGGCGWLWVVVGVVGGWLLVVGGCQDVQDDVYVDKAPA